jgi:hypothetical protein
MSIRRSSVAPCNQRQHSLGHLRTEAWWCGRMHGLPTAPVAQFTRFGQRAASKARGVTRQFNPRWHPLGRPMKACLPDIGGRREVTSRVAQPAAAGRRMNQRRCRASTTQCRRQARLSGCAMRRPSAASARAMGADSKTAGLRACVRRCQSSPASACRMVADRSIHGLAGRVSGTAASSGSAFGLAACSALRRCPRTSKSEPDLHSVESAEFESVRSTMRST